MAISKINTNSIADDAVTTAKVNPAQTDITSVGTLTGLTVSGDTTLTGDNYNVTWDKSANDLSFDDNAKLTFGAGNDLQIYHTPGTGTFIDEADDGALFIRSSRVTIHKYTGETMINAAADGAVSLYYNDVKVIETVDGGVEISGTLDMDGTELILDADGDTSITADTDDRIDIKVVNDIVHILSTGMGIGTNNPSHTLDLKASAPELMLEETSSGGSKRIGMGVESDGTPFISAEQSGGQIEVQLSGNNEFQFLNGGRFRVTRTGVPAYISRGPVTGVSVDNGSTTSVAGQSGVLFNLVLVSTGGGFGAVYSMAYNSTVNLIHGTGNFSASSGTSSSTNVYKSSGSHSVTLQNNTGSAVTYYILILSSYD